jgi:hypothetical protein
MPRDRKSPLELLIETGTKLVSKAAETVMSDPRGQDAVARAVGLAQRGRKKVEEVQEAVMKAAGIPGRQDMADLAKQLARLKRKARELEQELARRSAGGAGTAAAGSAGRDAPEQAGDGAEGSPGDEDGTDGSGRGDAPGGSSQGGPSR